MEGEGEEGTAESFVVRWGANIDYADYAGSLFCDGKDTDKNKKGAATVDLRSGSGVVPAVCIEFDLVTIRAPYMLIPTPSSSLASTPAKTRGMACRSVEGR